MTAERWQREAAKAAELFPVGTTVTLKGQKKRATVEYVHAPQTWILGNNWSGWVELNPPIGGYKNWHVDDLERVK